CPGQTRRGAGAARYQRATSEIGRMSTVPGVAPWRTAHSTPERRVEGVFGRIAQGHGHTRDRVAALDQPLASEHHPPPREIADRRLADLFAEPLGKRRA